MKITASKQVYWILGLVAAVALVGTGATMASGVARSGGDTPVQIDDGTEFLSQASISLEEAVATAQGVAVGKLGDVDLETHEGKLVFNVEIGAQDVKVDAADGRVLGQVLEHEEVEEEDD